MVLFKTEVWGEALEIGIGQFGKALQVVYRGEMNVLPTEGVDGFRLLVTEIRMALEALYGTGVYG